MISKKKALFASKENIKEVEKIKNELSKKDQDKKNIAKEIDEKIKILYSLIEELPSRQREVMRLKFQANLSYKEIAETIGISTSNVGFVLHSALKKLREDMKEKFPRKS